MNSALIILVGVIVTAFVTWSVAQRRIAVENVTKERAKWRRQVRNLVSQIYDELLFHKNNERQIKNLKMQLSVLLDPCDERDQQILCSIKTDSVEDFETEVKLMLKQDWERSKLEAGFFLCRWFLCVRRSEKCDVKKCEDKKCYRKKCEDKKWYRKMCDFKWCRKYKIRWFPFSCFLVMLFAIGAFIVLICNCMYCFEFCWCCHWLNSTCDAIDIESINSLFGCPGSWFPSNCQTY